MAGFLVLIYPFDDCEITPDLRLVEIDDLPKYYIILYEELIFADTILKTPDWLGIHSTLFMTSNPAV